MNEEIKKAVEVMRAGGVILYPTDTIWGLGCDPTNEDAVKKIFQIKQRSESQSLLVLADSIGMVERYVVEVPQMAYQLIEVTNKPLTIIYPQAKMLARNVIAEDGTIGIRITSDEFCQRLISQFRKPIISTSANVHGKPFPKTFADIDPVITSAVDFVVDSKFEAQTPRTPSSIIKVGLGGEIKIIRE